MQKVNDAVKDLMQVWDLALPETLPDVNEAYKDIEEILKKVSFVGADSEDIDKKKLTTVYFSYSFILMLKRGLLTIFKNRIERIKTIFLADRGQSLTNDKQPLFEEEKQFLTNYKELLSDYSSSVMSNAAQRNRLHDFIMDPILLGDEANDDEDDDEPEEEEDADDMGLTVNQILAPPTLELAQVEINSDVGEVITNGRIRHFAKGDRLLIAPEKAQEITTKGIAKLLK